MSAQPILELNSINMQYPGVKALDNLSLSFAKGEVHAICGENGAGKSTLIKIVTGAITPTSGEIRYLGERVEHQNPIASMEAGISCIYQEFNLIPYLSVMENVFFGNEPLKRGFVDYAAMRRRTIEIMRMLDIDIQPEQKVSDLTVGYQQIVEIAKALSREVKVLIMDEPSAPLTSRELVSLFRIVKNLRERGVTVIYISHRLEEVFELSDRISIIRDGQFVATLRTPDTSKDALIKLMVGRELINDYPNEVVPLGEVMLRVKNLNSKVLNDINFEVRQGEILGFAGLVGAGRTETARAIFGADVIDSGQIFIRGKEVPIPDPIAAIASGIGMIPEDRKQHGILARLSIKENMSFSALNRYVRTLFIQKKKERTDAQAIMTKLRVRAPNLETLVSALSGGNQQKVVLAKTLLTNSEIIFFDEPTRGIDVGAKQEIYALIKALAKEGKAVVMISSEMPELLGMSDRILVMHSGRIVKELQRSEFSQEAVLTYACGQASNQVN